MCGQAPSPPVTMLHFLRLLPAAVGSAYLLFYLLAACLCNLTGWLQCNCCVQRDSERCYRGCYMYCYRALNQADM